MLVKLSLVFCYCALLFVVTRILEFAGVFGRGMRCSEKFTDVKMLRTKRLHEVLDRRGVGYRYVSERTELVSLVHSSGNLCRIFTISK